MRTRSVHTRRRQGLSAIALITVLTIPGTSASVFAQSFPAPRLDLHVTSALLTQAATSGGQAAGAQAPAAGQTRRLTVDEAVKLALEHNLGIQIARYNPQAEDLSVAQAKAAWVPSFNNTFQKNSQSSPNNNFLAGSLTGKTTNAAFSNSTGVSQQLPWGGGNYSASWDGSRSTTNSTFTNFSPQLRSGLSLSAVQPLMRNFSIDSMAAAGGDQHQEPGDLGRRPAPDNRHHHAARCATPTGTWRTRPRRWACSASRSSSRRSRCANTRSRVEIGTTPPIDIVEAESEVATREEGRSSWPKRRSGRPRTPCGALVFDPSAPDFWTMTIEALDVPSFQPIPVDTDAAVRNALDKRTDLLRQTKTLEVDDVQIRYLRNQTLPDVNAQFDYGLSGLGGLNLVRGPGPFGPGSGSVIDTVGRSFGAVLGDVFANRYPQWTASLNFSYPIGASQQEANLARARIEYSQAQTQLKNQQLQVSTQVRERRGRCRRTRSGWKPRAPRARSPSAGSRPSSASSRPARLRASSSSRRSGIWRRRATTSSRRSSTMPSRSSTSRPCRKCP
jgi:hypothetical protein